MGKKNNPGCNCCDNPVCTRCMYKCDGDLCPPICGFRINLGEVATVPSFWGDGEEQCPAVTDICADEAPCNRCYDFFDRRFTGFFDDYRWTKSYIYPSGYRDCNNIILRHQLSPLAGAQFCWDLSNYNCPYLPSVPPFIGLCASGLFFRDAVIDMHSQWNEDTNCGTLTVTIEVEIFAPRCIEDITLPERVATFTHVFEKSYCTCEEMLEPIPFVSTTADNPYDLIEPCNLHDATIQLIEDNESKCRQCYCFECSSDDTILLSIEGPGFTGTVPVPLNTTGNSSIVVGGVGTITANCFYFTTINIDCAGEQKQLVIGLNVECKDCEFYEMNLVLNLAGQESYQRIFYYDCSEAVFQDILTFPPVIEDCDLNDYTFSL